jgi:AraC family transcriptional regulator
VSGAHRTGVTRVVLRTGRADGDRNAAGQLDAVLDLGTLAATASLSPFHVHRVFRAMVGETPIELTPGESGGRDMQVQIEHRPELRVGTVRHIGPYNQIGAAFARLGSIAGAAGLFAQPDPKMVGLYHDDPDSTPPEALRSDAAISVPEGQPMPEGLVERRIPAGRYACYVHVGPYDRLGDAWSRLMGEWLPASGYRRGEGPSYEVYLSDMQSVAPAELRTELCIALADR